MSFVSNLLLRILSTFLPDNYFTFSKKLLPNSDAIFAFSLPMIHFSNNPDPFGLTLGTLLLITITPFCACLILAILRTSTFLFLGLLTLLDTTNLLGIFIIIYHFHCDDLLSHGDIHPLPGPTTPYFKFMHWNANSLPAHDFIRVPLIQAYNSIHNFHLIAITETALKNDVPNDKIDIPGYTPIRCDLTGNDTHGGVMIYHKNDISVKNRPDLCLTSYTIVLELSISKKNCSLCAPTENMAKPAKTSLHTLKNLTKFWTRLMVRTLLVLLSPEISTPTINLGLQRIRQTILDEPCSQFLRNTYSTRL